MSKHTFEVVVPGVRGTRKREAIPVVNKDTERLDWWERQHTLHRSLELTYVVDEFLLQELKDGQVMSEYSCSNIRACIDAAMKVLP